MEKRFDSDLEKAIGSEKISKHLNQVVRGPELNLFIRLNCDISKLWDFTDIFIKAGVPLFT